MYRIACKARFQILIALLLLICQSFFSMGIHTHALWFSTPIVHDSVQRDLSAKLRYLLFRAEFRIAQTGYGSSSGNLGNVQIMTQFLGIAGLALSRVKPEDIDHDLYTLERFTVRLYESLARRYERLNPIPGLYYDIYIRNPAYPFLYFEALDKYYFHMGAFPFMDDLRFRETSIASRQWGLGFRILF